MTLNQAAQPDQKSRVLDFVRARFMESFGAQVADDTPTLIGGFDHHGELVAAFGLRDAESGFFCEHYLTDPLEQAIGRRLGHEVQRSRIVEITHLCATRPGCLGQLIALLPPALMDRGYRYLACTATACLAAYFSRRGLEAHTLAGASAAALSVADRAAWGRYYAAGPRVLAGDLAQAGTRLPLRTGAVVN